MLFWVWVFGVGLGGGGLGLSGLGGFGGLLVFGRVLGLVVGVWFVGRVWVRVLVFSGGVVLVFVGFGVGYWSGL